MLAIEVEGLEKTYPKGVKALDGLLFSAEEGEVFGLLGPNGARATSKQRRKPACPACTNPVSAKSGRPASASDEVIVG